MIGYVLIGIGAWLVFDDWKIARAKKLKEGGSDGQLHKNGNDRGRGDSAGKSGTIHQKPDRDRGIGIPVKGDSNKSKGKKGVADELSKKPVHKVKSGQNSDSPGDNRGGQPDSTPVGDQGQSLKNKKSKEGGEDAGTEINSENGISDNGDHVHLESDSRNESDGAETD